MIYECPQEPKYYIIETKIKVSPVSKKIRLCFLATLWIPGVKQIAAQNGQQNEETVEKWQQGGNFHLNFHRKKRPDSHNPLNTTQIVVEPLRFKITFSRLF